MKKLLSLVCVLAFVLALFNCKIENNDDNPVPTLTSFAPAAKVSHMPAFTLTVYGSNFVAGSRIVFNGIEKASTYVNDTELNCRITPNDTLISTPRVENDEQVSTAKDSMVTVFVRNPSPGGGDSSSLNFTIYSNHSFYTSQNISNNFGDSNDPDIVVDSAGNINVAWSDNSTGVYEIYFSRSADNGATWSLPVYISWTAALSWKPAVAVNSMDDLFVVWSDLSLDERIYFSRSTDYGATWSIPVNLSATAIGTSPAIAVDNSGNINVAWNFYTPTLDNIYFSRSTDNGASWTPPVNISWTAGWSWTPAIAADTSGNLFVAWWDLTVNEEIYFSRSTDSGVTWSFPLNLSNTPVGESTTPDIAVDNSGNINVIWDDEFPDPDELVYFSRSTNGGATWTTPADISNNAPFDYGSVIAVDTAVNINVVWRSWTTGRPELFFSRSIDDGVNWSFPVNVSNITPNCERQAIAVDSAGNIYIVWEGSAGEIYFNTSVP